MSVSRLRHIARIGVEQMGDLADGLADPEVLRLENLDTDIPPPAAAVARTRAAAGEDAANSYLPFLGLDSLRRASAALVGRQAGQDYDWRTECVISAGGDDGIAESVAELQARRDLLLDELAGFDPVRPHGGWSFLIDVSPLGLDGPRAAALLLERGKIAATPMIDWGGPSSADYVRLVFANEPVERLRGIGDRFRRALT